MPKTIATTPSWYWPEGVSRVLGIPPVPVQALAVDGPARRDADATAAVWGDVVVSAGELGAQVHAVARALRHHNGSGPIMVAGGPSLPGAVAVLGAMASGRPTILVAPEAASDAVRSAASTDDLVAVADDDGLAALRAAGIAAEAVDDLLARAHDVAATPGNGAGEPSDAQAPAVRLGGRDGPVWHSHRSLLAGALAQQAFLAPAAGSPWLSMASPCTWDGLCNLLVARISGSPLVLARPGPEAEEAATRHTPAWMSGTMDDAGGTWSGGRRRKRGGGGEGRYLLATVDGPFDPDERRSVGAAAGADVLTVFGQAETGPVLAAHPSWFLDEAVGVPVPNMHVLPADPDTGEPVDVLWELLDRAMVSVWSPSLAVEGIEPGPGLPAGRRYVTGVLAASDPNGMLYLVDE